jgi:hypothetical protein
VEAQHRYVDRPADHPPGAEDSINLVPDAGAKRQLLRNGATRPRIRPADGPGLALQ